MKKRKKGRNPAPNSSERADLREAWGYHDLGLFEDSLASIRSLPEERKKDGDVLYLQCLNLLEIGEDEELMDLVDQAMELHPGNSAWIELKRRLLRATEGEKAATAFLTMRLRRLFERARTEAKMGNFPNALQLVPPLFEFGASQWPRKIMNHPDFGGFMSWFRSLGGDDFDTE